MVEHGRDGWLVTPQDPTALALALVRLLADRELRNKIAAAGQRTARRYAWPEIARRVLAVYRGQRAAAPRVALPAGAHD